MSPIAFARAVLASEPIKLFNHGRTRRDFTFVGDIVEGVVRTLAIPPAPCVESGARYAIYNIGNHQAVGLEEYIDTLAAALGRAAVKD
jgi:UDP-glucuronate 4-epimerase